MGWDKNNTWLTYPRSRDEIAEARYHLGLQQSLVFIETVGLNETGWNEMRTNEYPDNIRDEQSM